MPADVRANIIALTDMDGDGYVSQEEFLQLANGRNIPGFNRRRRRALRELLKQTVEFIVSHTDCFSVFNHDTLQYLKPKCDNVKIS